MSKLKSIPAFITISTLNQDQSLITLSKKVDQFNEGKKYGERIMSSHFNTIQIIIKEYCKKFRHKSARGGKLRITVGNLAKLAKCCVKSAYNHINRLIEAEFLKKSSVYQDFGSGFLTLCLELDINKALLSFQEKRVSAPVDKSVDIPIGIVPTMDPSLYAKLRELGFVGG